MQGLAIVAFHVIPAFTLLYFAARFWAGTAWIETVSVTKWEHYWPPVLVKVVGKYDPSSDGKLAADYFRFWEPWLLTVATPVAIVYVARHLMAVFERSSANQSSH